jgi:hypothetical protein
VADHLTRLAEEVRLAVVVIGLVVAGVWNIAFFRLPSGADYDIHRYVWDGPTATRISSSPAILPLKGCIPQKPAP